MYDLDTGKLHFQGDIRGHLRHCFQLGGADGADRANGRGGAAPTATVQPRRSAASTGLMARVQERVQCALHYRERRQKDSDMVMLTRLKSINGTSSKEQKYRK